MTDAESIPCLVKWQFASDPFSEKFFPNKVWERPKDETGYIKYRLNVIKQSKDKYNILIIGDYGSGKTYLINVLSYFIKEKMKCYSIYFNMPLPSEAIGIKDILKQFFNAIKIDEIVRVSREICDENKISTYEEYETFLSSKLIHEDVIKAICNLQFDKEYVLTTAWLSGKSNLLQVRKLEFNTISNDESTILNILSDIIRFLGIKYGLVGIFVDEVENLVGTSRATRSIRDGIRNLYDQAIYKTQTCGILFCFALTARTAFEFDNIIGGALLDRIDRQVFLKPLDLDEQKNFIKYLFKWAKSEGREENSLKPFKDEKALEYFLNSVPDTPIIPKSRSSGETGTPRRIIKVGAELFGDACYKGLDVITHDKIKDILQV